MDLGQVDFKWELTSKGKGRIEVVGMQQFLAKLENRGLNILEQSKKALADELDKILKETLKITPKDTGALRASGRVFKPRSNSRTQTATFELVFGGVTRLGKFVDYAEEVHENPKHFKFKVGEEKFLEKTWNRMRPGLEQRIASRIK